MWTVCRLCEQGASNTIYVDAGRLMALFQRLCGGGRDMHSSGYVRLQGTTVFNKSMLFKRKAVLIEGLNEQQVREEEENSWTFNQPPSTCSPHTQGFYVNWKPLFLQCLLNSYMVPKPRLHFVFNWKPQLFWTILWLCWLVMLCRVSIFSYAERITFRSRNWKLKR